MDVLVFAVGTRRCALPLADVAEVMRAQPLASHGLLTPGVLGTAIIRSQPTPVVDAGQLLNGASTRGDRLVLLRVGSRPVALAVDSVIGTSAVHEQQLTNTPALLNGSDAVVEAIGVVDSQLIHLLHAVRLLKDSTDEPLATEARNENGPAVE